MTDTNRGAEQNSFWKGHFPSGCTGSWCAASPPLASLEPSMEGIPTPFTLSWLPCVFHYGWCLRNFTACLRSAWLDKWLVVQCPSWTTEATCCLRVGTLRDGGVQKLLLLHFILHSRTFQGHKLQPSPGADMIGTGYCVSLGIWQSCASILLLVGLTG